MRTLTFGDRTISYDAGLDTINNGDTGNEEFRYQIYPYSTIYISIHIQIHRLSCPTLPQRGK